MKAPKSKFNFRLTQFVDPGIIRIYLMSLASVVLLALLVIVGVSIYRSVKTREEMKKPGLYTENDISSILKSPGLTDFIIPESLESGIIGFTPYREPLKEWSNEMVERYIIPPEELGIASIREDNKKTIESKLDSIP